MSPDIILETEGLTKEFRGFVAVKNVSPRVRRGSIRALIGPNGAGKTTCFNLLTHFLTPTAGRIRFKNRDITGSKPADIARMGLVRSFQISAVFPHLTVLENVRIALQRKRGSSFDFWRSERVLDALNERALGLIEAVGLRDFARTPAVELPYGRKRALEIATTLALDPEMMLLDEPTAGMTHEDVDRITALIKRVAANRTVLMVEHNLGVVENLSDTITVLARGEVLAEVLKAIRENEPRTTSLGYRAEHYKLIAFVLSATLSGLAGGTKAIVFQLASLTDVHWTMSGEVVLMTLLGGLGTVFGPVLGAFIIIGLENYLATLGAWVTIVQGVIFVVCVLTFRRSVVGELARLLKKPL